MMEPFRVWQDVYLIGGPDLTSPSDCLVYLLDCDDLVLIDCGAGESFEALVRNIRYLHFDPRRVKMVIATHGHIDHIGSLWLFQERFAAQVVAHRDDARAIETGAGTGASFYGLPYEVAKVDRRLENPEETIEVGRHRLQVLHIPGHTPGSIAIYLDLGKRILFGQDVHGPYLSAWGANPSQAATSLKKLMALEADILCEGHFGIIQPAAAVKTYIEGYLDYLRALTGET